MKKILLLCALAIPMCLAAQKLSVQSVQKITVPAQADTKIAGISPDGQFILLTTGTNQGLQKFDIATKKMTTLSNAEGAGYNVKISDDGKNVVYRETTIGNDKMRYYKLLSKNIEKNTKKTIISKTRDLESFSIQGNTVVAVNNKQIKKVNIGTVATQAELPVLSIKDRQLMISRNGKSEILSPNGTNESYLWPSVSPDGTKICYYVGGTGTFVANIDGTNAKLVARGLRAAKWYNNAIIVAMADKDNGEFVTESRIVACTLDGNQQVLTNNNVIAMYPYACEKSKVIVFSTDNGEIYLLNLK